MSEQVEHIPTPKLVYFTKTWHAKPYSFISPTRPELSAAGKNVLITGGGTGIGKATAIAFARAGAASIAIVGRRRAPLETTAAEISALRNQDVKMIVESADIMQRESIDAAFANIRNQVGEIDIFIPSAGILPSVAPLRGYDAAEFQRGLDLNVMGSFNALQAFLPIAKPEAMILNVSSLFGHIAPAANSVAYAVNKIAVLKMYEYLAAENPGFHLVSVQPGIIATEINAAYEVDCPDDGKLSPIEPDDRRHGVSQCMNTDLKSSPTPWRLSRVASVARGQIPQREVCMGELGCGGVDSPSKGDRGVPGIDCISRRSRCLG